MPVKPGHFAGSEEDVNGLLGDGTATAPSLQDIPPFFSASSQAPASDLDCVPGWPSWRDWGEAAGGSLGGDGHTW